MREYEREKEKEGNRKREIGEIEREWKREREERERERENQPYNKPIPETGTKGTQELTGLGTEDDLLEIEQTTVLWFMHEPSSAQENETQKMTDPQNVTRHHPLEW